MRCRFQGIPRHDDSGYEARFKGYPNHARYGCQIEVVVQPVKGL